MRVLSSAESCVDVLTHRLRGLTALAFLSLFSSWNKERKCAELVLALESLVKLGDSLRYDCSKRRIVLGERTNEGSWPLCREFMHRKALVMPSLEQVTR